LWGGERQKKRVREKRSERKKKKERGGYLITSVFSHTLIRD